MLVYSSKNFDDFVERPALTLKQCCSSNPYAFKVDNNYYHAMKFQYLFKRIFKFLCLFFRSNDKLFTMVATMWGFVSNIVSTIFSLNKFRN